MQAQMLTILPDDYLAKVDLATMGVSLEARCPFLDIDLVELAMRVPANVRFRGGQPKGLLRRFARRYLPPECVNRRKQGFVLPVGRWLQKDWADLVHDVILGSQVEMRGWFRREALERIVANPGKSYHGFYLLWTLLILEMWLRMTVDRTV
jgi:asparagine synthase (glutamine-hydrolysing)